jgi:hypothetical protein
MLLFYHIAFSARPVSPEFLHAGASQQILKKPQMLAAHLRLVGRPHHGASRAIKHPLRHFQQADSSVVFAHRMQHCTRPTFHRSFDRDRPAEPRMPRIDNLQLATMSILSCGCTTSSAGIPL